MSEDEKREVLVQLAKEMLAYARRPGVCPQKVRAEYIARLDRLRMEWRLVQELREKRAKAEVEG